MNVPPPMAEYLTHHIPGTSHPAALAAAATSFPAASSLHHHGSNPEFVPAGPAADGMQHYKEDKGGVPGAQLPEPPAVGVLSGATEGAEKGGAAAPKALMVVPGEGHMSLVLRHMGAVMRGAATLLQLPQQTAGGR